MKKINSEININLPNLKAKWGTIDKKNPSSIYLEVGSYITPKKDEESYTDEIQNIDKEVKEIVKSAIAETNSISNNFIFVSDVADTRICFGKKSYLSFQIHLGRKNTEDKKPFKEIVKNLDERWSGVYSGIISAIENNGFHCSKTKK